MRCQAIEEQGSWFVGQGCPPPGKVSHMVKSLEPGKVRQAGAQQENRAVGWA